MNEVVKRVLKKYNVKETVEELSSQALYSILHFYPRFIAPPAVREIFWTFEVRLYSYMNLLLS
jgi:hypothetical protein